MRSPKTAPKAEAKPAAPAKAEAQPVEKPVHKPVAHTIPHEVARALSVAQSYRDKTDPQVMEVMHGDPQTMLSDVRALSDAVLSVQPK